MAMITISCLSITVTVGMLSIFHTNEENIVPRSLKEFTKLFLKCLLPRGEKQGSAQLFPANSELSSASASPEADDAIKMEPLCEIQIAPNTASADNYPDVDDEDGITYLPSTRNPDPQERLTSQERIINDWKEIALVFDKVFGFMLFIATAVVLLYVIFEFIIIQSNLYGPVKEHNPDEHD